MKRFIEMLVTALLAVVIFISFVFMLLWALQEPIYGAQHKHTAKLASCRMMNSNTSHIRIDI